MLFLPGKVSSEKRRAILNQIKKLPATINGTAQEAFFAVLLVKACCTLNFALFKRKIRTAIMISTLFTREFYTFTREFRTFTHKFHFTRKFNAFTRELYCFTREFHAFSRDVSFTLLLVNYTFIREFHE
jgi:hypothetical protein